MRASRLCFILLCQISLSQVWFFDTIFFMVFRVHLKVSEKYCTSFLHNSTFSCRKYWFFTLEKNFLTLWAQVWSWCLDFIQSYTDRYYFHYSCFDNSYVSLKFLEKIVDYNSIVEQNSLPIHHIFDVDLWICLESLLYSKLN
jgi:hypothetical protein